MKLDILGTKYDFNITTSSKDPGLNGVNGYCDIHSKSMAVECDYSTNAHDSIKDIESFKKHVKRHEIVHAYFAESGLVEHSENEQLVDWIAWMAPRMIETFGKVDAL